MGAQTVDSQREIGDRVLEEVDRFEKLLKQSEEPVTVNK
jgi:hypothetical protein